MKPRIIWEIDLHGWAMEHLARHVMGRLTEFEHVVSVGNGKNPPVSPFLKGGEKPLPGGRGSDGGGRAHGRGRGGDGRGGEIRVLMYMGQFKRFDGNQQTIMHLDGNRWYENYDIKFDI
jgi:hypothetical protein